MNTVRKILGCLALAVLPFLFSGCAGGASLGGYSAAGRIAEAYEVGEKEKAEAAARGVQYENPYSPTKVLTGRVGATMYKNLRAEHAAIRAKGGGSGGQKERMATAYEAAVVNIQNMDIPPEQKASLLKQLEASKHLYYR